MKTTEYRGDALAPALQRSVLRPMKTLVTGQENHTGVYAIKTNTATFFWVHIEEILRTKEDGETLVFLEFVGTTYGRRLTFCWNATKRPALVHADSVIIEGIELV